MIARWLAGVALAAGIAVPGVARAFPTGDQFDLDPLTEDGGGGVPFTGAPRNAGHTCAVCHAGAPGRIGLRLLADPDDLFTAGYQPTTTYRMRVVIDDEWAAADRRAAGDQCADLTTPYSRCDDNGFALEVDAADGYPEGRFAPVVDGACATAAAPGVDIRVLDDSTAVTQSGSHHGQVAWDLCWTAPGAGTGPVTAYLAAVDGNGGGGTIEDPDDVDNDDVVAGAVPIAERGGDPLRPQVGGCSAGRDLSLGAVALVLAMLLGRRRRGVAAMTVAAIAVTSAGGCATVQPHEKEYLARRKMVFAPDPTEDELDLHMQESREGSVGGYGSAGGGCGCN